MMRSGFSSVLMLSSATLELIRRRLFIFMDMYKIIGYGRSATTASTVLNMIFPRSQSQEKRNGNGV